MPLNFPNNPLNGDIYTANNTVWIYNGTVSKWEKAPRGYPALVNATQAVMEAGTADSGTYVSPATVKFSESVAKSYGAVNQTGTQAIIDSFNVASITDTGAGGTDFNFTNNMVLSNYTRVCEGGRTSFNQSGIYPTSVSSSSTRVNSYQLAAGTDVNNVNTAVYGDLA